MPFKICGHLFNSVLLSSLLHDTETRPISADALQRLRRNDRAMIRWIYGVKPSNVPSKDDLHDKLGRCDIAVVIREQRLRRYGQVLLHDEKEIHRVRSITVPGVFRWGRPTKTWEEIAKQELKMYGLKISDALDKGVWNVALRNSRLAPKPSETGFD